MVTHPILKVKKLHEDAELRQAYASASCFDVKAVDSGQYDFAQSLVTYKLGIALDIPEGYEVLIYPRSSIGKTSLSLANSVGVVDEDYTGELFVVFRCSDIGKAYSVGDFVCQIKMQKKLVYGLQYVDEISKVTERGSQGFGSSGN